MVKMELLYLCSIFALQKSWSRKNAALNKLNLLYNENPLSIELY